MSNFADISQKPTFYMRTPPPVAPSAVPTPTAPKCVLVAAEKRARPADMARPTCGRGFIYGSRLACWNASRRHNKPATRPGPCVSLPLRVADEGTSILYPLTVPSLVSESCSELLVFIFETTHAGFTVLVFIVVLGLYLQGNGI